MPLSPLSSNKGLETYQGPWTKQTTTHLLNRVLFGAKHAEIQQFLAKGLNASVTELLNPTAPLPAPHLMNTTQPPSLIQLLLQAPLGSIIQPMTAPLMAIEGIALKNGLLV